MYFWYAAVAISSKSRPLLKAERNNGRRTTQSHPVGSGASECSADRSSFSSRRGSTRNALQRTGTKRTSAPVRCDAVRLGHPRTERGGVGHQLAVHRDENVLFEAPRISADLHGVRGNHGDAPNTHDCHGESRLVRTTQAGWARGATLPPTHWRCKRPAADLS